jgi:hypothetical protein
MIKKETPGYLVNVVLRLLCNTGIAARLTASISNVNLNVNAKHSQPPDVLGLPLPHWPDGKEIMKLPLSLYKCATLSVSQVKETANNTAPA